MKRVDVFETFCNALKRVSKGGLSEDLFEAEVLLDEPADGFDVYEYSALREAGYLRIFGPRAAGGITVTVSILLAFKRQGEDDCWMGLVLHIWKILFCLLGMLFFDCTGFACGLLLGCVARFLGASDF